jgi:FkbM family methyltransferase
MRAHAVAAVTRFYPFLSGCGTLANHRVINALSGRSGEAWANVEGGKLSVSLDDYVGRAAFFVGDLDRKVSAIIDRFVNPGDTVLDIGANIGLVSLRLSKRVGSTGSVHAFEPNPSIADRLRASLDQNGITNVHVHQVALGPADDVMRLSVPEGNAGAASLVHTRGTGIDVPVKRLDDFSLSPAFVKMDVEGFEDQVLKGFLKTLRNHHPRAILFEQNDDRGQSIPLLRDVGYRIFGVAKTLMKLKLDPVSSWRPDYHDYVAIHGCSAAIYV